MYSDPTGEFALNIGGAVIAAGIDVAIQLATNGGRFECINIEEVLIAGAIGAFNPFSEISAINKALTAQRQFSRADNLKKGSRAAKKTRQRGYKHNRAAYKEAAFYTGVEAAAYGISTQIPDEYRINLSDDCGCN